MLYPLFLLLAAIEMLAELRISIRNSTRLSKKGAIEIDPWILPLMAFLYVLMFVGSLLEYLLIPKAISLVWALLFGGLFLLAKSLKFWAVAALGPFWTMKLLVLPGSSVVTAGPYRWIRHPNYSAVLLEIAGITLLGKSYLTFCVVFLSFSIILYHRIRSEEDALRKHTDYADQLVSKGRFLP